MMLIRNQIVELLDYASESNSGGNLYHMDGQTSDKSISEQIDIGGITTKEKISIGKCSI